jgi:predicted nucleic acid-binding protein
MAASPVFVDTSVIVAAVVAEHPAHDEGASVIDRLVKERAPLLTRPQVCRELLVVLTRQQVHDCNIVAVMLANKMSRLATRNAADFKRFDEITLEPLSWHPSPPPRQ